MTSNEEDIILINSIRKGDKEAGEKLAVKYSPMIKKECRILYIVGAEMDDLMQEGYISLIKAIYEYDPESNVRFFTYATQCVKNGLRTAVTKSNRQKNIPLNFYISIYSDDDEDEYKGNAIDTLSLRLSKNPETEFINEERFNEIMGIINNSLSPMEKKVANLFLQGYSYADIGEKLNKDEQSVTNALTRIRRKLKALGK